MRIKFTLILVVLILSFGFTSTSGINTTVSSWKGISEVEADKSEAYKDVDLVLENGSVMNCTFKSKKTTVQNLGNKGLSVSISSNWNCK